MDSISLNKENGLKLWANDWNKLVSTINLIIEVVNTLGDNPAITKLSLLTNDSGFVTALDLAKVASTGNYNDLSNKPLNLLGDSAYQVAVNSGFTGTELEWLASLKGDTGLDGSNGQDGVPGLDGNDGLSAYQLAVLEGYDGTLQQWLASLHGQDGQNGSNGTNGITPHIDLTTGNWFIGSTDTGVQAQGPAGQNGTNGSNGQDGHTPVITAAKSNGVTTVSVDGTAIATINDGQDGSVANLLLADWNQSDSGLVDYIKNKPTIPTVPTNISSFINDAGYLTSHQSLSGYIQTSNTAGLIKNDGTIDTNTYLTSAPVTSVNGQTGVVSLTIPSTTGMVTSSTAGLKIEVVASLPASPDSNTIYIVQ